MCSSDLFQPTPETRVGLNPNHDWNYRALDPVNPLGSGHFLVAIIIGKLPKGTTHDQVRTLLEQVSLPQKNQIPNQSCVTWVEQAILMLQQAAYADNIDIDVIVKGR